MFGWTTISYVKISWNHPIETTMHNFRFQACIITHLEQWKKLSCLGYIGDYTTQLHDIWGLCEINNWSLYKQPPFHGKWGQGQVFFRGSLGPTCSPAPVPPRPGVSTMQLGGSYSEAVATPISKKFSVTLDEHLDEFEVFYSWYQKMHLKISQKLYQRYFVVPKKHSYRGIFFMDPIFHGTLKWEKNQTWCKCMISLKDFPTITMHEVWRIHIYLEIYFQPL